MKAEHEEPSSGTRVRRRTAIETPGAPTVDATLEVATAPASGLDRAGRPCGDLAVGSRRPTSRRPSACAPCAPPPAPAGRHRAGSMTGFIDEDEQALGGRGARRRHRRPARGLRRGHERGAGTWSETPGTGDHRRIAGAMLVPVVG